VNVYALGNGYFPGARGIFLTKMIFENGAWRLSTGQIWEIARDTDVFPTLGYSQDVRGYYDSSTRLLHIYNLRGFYPQNGGDERIDYYTLQMN
jgi:hypothetical protein